MAGALTISTLNDSSGVLAVRNGMTGIAKAWVTYNGVAQTIRASFNVSSVTYSSSGKYIVNFTTAMPTTNYCATGMASLTSSGNNYARIVQMDNSGAMTASSLSLDVMKPATEGEYNTEIVCVAVYSS
jgi:hypothetical protein